MTLVPVADDAGHWRDPNWDGKSAGTFAIVIGCSTYTFLKDGKKTSPLSKPWMKEAHRLGQLYVSALTARKFFDWISGEYALDGAPPVSCRMLLSPTADELAVDPRINDNLLEPTLANCKTAITHWLKDIKGLPKAEREASRMVFFFSGHGLQSTADQQILLPSDYLGDDLQSFNHALSTQNLLHGLKTIEVPYRFYFLDACRNDANEIRMMRPKGDEFLPVYPTSSAYKKIETDAILYATTEAQQAWQPTEPEKGPTLFGQALLDGLRGTPHIKLQVEGSKSCVGFFALEEYMSGRIKELLDMHQSSDEQRVEPGGLTRPRTVAELPAAVAETVEFTSPADPAGRIHGAKWPIEYYALKDVGEFQIFSATRSFDSEFDFNDQPENDLTSFEASRALPVNLQTTGWRQNFEIGHKLFGHETVTQIFSYNMHVAALGRRHWLPEDKVRLLRVDRTEIAAKGGQPEQTRYRIVVGISNDDNVGHWLQLSGGSDGAVGVFLPRVEIPWSDQMAQYLLRLNVSHHRGPDIYGVRFNTLSATPMAVDDDPVSEATRLWLRSQSSSAQNAITDFEGSQLEEILRGKMLSPTAAIIASLVLLRSGRFDLLHDWLRNVMNWFPQYPDGAVLWAEQVMRQATDPALAVEEAAEALATLPDRGLPMTSEGLSYAASLLDRLTPDRDIMDNVTRTGFDRAKELVDGALVLFRPDGLFTSLANFETTIPPAAPDNVAPAIAIGSEGITIHGIHLGLKQDRKT